MSVTHLESCVQHQPLSNVATGARSTVSPNHAFASLVSVEQNAKIVSIHFQSNLCTVCSFSKFLGMCNFDCGNHGHCENNNCICNEGWTGTKCSSKSCAPGCEDHGMCHNGTCVCNQGWNGDNCLLGNCLRFSHSHFLLKLTYFSFAEGCLNDCSKHGQCQKSESKWQCLCDPSYTGLDCGIPLELQCSDKIDNDNGTKVERYSIMVFFLFVLVF